MSDARRPRPDRVTLLTFDFEGRWGMPHDAPYDLDRTTSRVLEALSTRGARATFFVVGELAVQRPDLIQTIATGGHEIALHGWHHEDLSRLTAGGLANFRDGLNRSISAIATATGSPPDGFRAPYLLAPRFHDQRVHEVLLEREFRFTSNRELRHPVELLRPDRLGSERPWRALASRGMLQAGAGGGALRAALNSSLWLPIGGQAPRPRLRWLRRGCPPFYRQGILELPLYAPMDCDLLGLPRPEDPSPPALLEFTRAALNACLQTAGPLTVLTFHDWILATEARLGVLRGAVSFATATGWRVSSVREAWDAVLARAEPEAP